MWLKKKHILPIEPYGCKERSIRQKYPLSSLLWQYHSNRYLCCKSQELWTCSKIIVHKEVESLILHTYFHCTTHNFSYMSVDIPIGGITQHKYFYAPLNRLVLHVFLEGQPTFERYHGFINCNCLMSDIIPLKGSQQQVYQLPDFEKFVSIFRVVVPIIIVGKMKKATLSAQT